MAPPQCISTDSQGINTGAGGWLDPEGSRGQLSLEPSICPSRVHSCCVLFSKLGVLFSCNREGAFPQRCVSPALLFPELSVSFYSPVRELKDELKSNTFVWEWDVCQTAGIELLELALSVNVSPARIAGRILKVTWTRPDF